MAGVVAAARANVPVKSDRIITIRSLSDFEEGFKWLSDDLPEKHFNGKFRGIASGFFVQEALEGGHGITDIHYDLTGVQNMKDPKQNSIHKGRNAMTEEKRDSMYDYVRERYEKAIAYYDKTSRNNKRAYKVTRILTLVFGSLVTLASSLSSAGF